MSEPTKEGTLKAASTRTEEEKVNEAHNQTPSKKPGERGGEQPPKERGGPGLPKRKVPPEIFAKAKLIAQRSNIPVGWAIPVAQGEKTLSQQLDALRLREQVDSLVAQGLVSRRHAIEVFKGNLTLEQAKFETRLRERKQDQGYCHCHFEDFVAGAIPAGVAVVGRRLLYGTVVSNQKYTVVLKTENEELTLHKHDIKFYFPAEVRKTLMKQVSWGTGETVLKPGSLKRLKARVDIKARKYLEAMEQGRTIRWETVEGDVLKGKVTYFGKWEVVLETAKGQRVVMLRHAVNTVQ